MVRCGTMTAAWQAANDATRTRWRRELDLQIVALLGAPLPAVGLAASGWPELVEALAAAVGDALADPTYPLDRERSADLLRGLTDERGGSVSDLLDELGEVLFLPRHERREWADTDGSSPPFRIRKLLLEYATKAHHLDALTSALSKDFCARSCERLPVGCCSVLGYDMGVVPETMLRLQRLEAGRLGWRPAGHGEKCPYHGPRGCVLALFKTPHCLGFFCDDLRADLAARFPAAPLAIFYGALDRFRPSYVDRRDIFAAMEEVIGSGQAVLASACRDRPGDGR